MHGLVSVDEFVCPNGDSIRLLLGNINVAGVVMLANTECCGNDIEFSTASDEAGIIVEEDVTIGKGVVVELLLA